MNIILYLLQIIQYLYQQNCFLIQFICKYIPLKQWAFDDFHSPEYQKFKTDELPKIIKKHRPYKQMIERLNRTYKMSSRPTNGFDSHDGVNYDLALWVANYNFLRPHKHNKYQVLNKVERLENASNMPPK